VSAAYDAALHAWALAYFSARETRGAALRTLSLVAATCGYRVVFTPDVRSYMYSAVYSSDSALAANLTDEAGKRYLASQNREQALDFLDVVGRAHGALLVRSSP
jgi:hypothetical protein